MLASAGDSAHDLPTTERNSRSTRMERPPSGRDVIGTYLERVGTIRSPTDNEMAQQAVEPSWAQEEPSPVQTEAPPSVSPESEAATQQSRMALVLSLLAEARQLQLPDLVGRLGIPTLEAAVLLTKLSSTGLVSIAGDPGRELVSITESGMTIAELSAS
jgi:predicted transcriptional regulator